MVHNESVACRWCSDSACFLSRRSSTQRCSTLQLSKTASIQTTSGCSWSRILLAKWKARVLASFQIGKSPLQQGTTLGHLLSRGMLNCKVFTTKAKAGFSLSSAFSQLARMLGEMKQEALFSFPHFDWGTMPQVKQATAQALAGKMLSSLSVCWLLFLDASTCLKGMAMCLLCSRPCAAALKLTTPASAHDARHPPVAAAKSWRGHQRRSAPPDPSATGGEVSRARVSQALL